MLGIEYVGIGMLVLEIIYVIRQKSSYMQNLMLILLISLLLNFTGYLLELTSRDQESALLGVKLAYLGKPYIMLSIFFFVMALCKIRVPLILKNIQIGFQLLITILVLTCEHHHLTIARSDIQPPEVIRIWCWSMVSFIICIYS